MFRPMVLGSTALALVLSTAALAMPQVPIIPLDTLPGQNYATLDGQWSQVPKDNFSWLETCPFNGKNGGKSIGHYCEDPTPFLDASHTFDSWGGGGIVGFTMKNPWMGVRQRFEIGVAGLTGDRDDSRSDSPPVEQMAEANLIGQPLDMEAHAHTSYDAYAVVERTLFDFEVSNNFTITPNVGVVFRHSRNGVNADGSWENGGRLGFDLQQIGGTTLAHRNEVVTQAEFGLELGTTASYDLSKALKLFAGVNAEFVHRFGELNSRSCFIHEYNDDVRVDSVPSSSCGGGVMQPSLVGNGGHGFRSNDRQTDFAVNVTLSLGASYSFPGGTTISVIGYAQNEDNLVAADASRHQETTGTLDFGGGGPGGSGRHLESRRDWVPGAVVALTIPFGGG